MQLIHGIILSAVLCGLSLAASWTPSSGNADTFHYSNGQDVNGRFGTPVVADDKFVFAPSSFEANAPTGPASDSDTLSVDLLANPGREFSTVTANIRGDYAVEGGVQVTFNGTLSVDYGTGPVNVPVTFAPSSPITSGEGLISGVAVFNVPAGIDTLLLDLSAGLTAQANSGQTSFVAVLNTDITVATVPEPASLGSLACAGALLLRRRA